MHLFIIHIFAKEPTIYRFSSPPFSLFEILAVALLGLGSGVSMGQLSAAGTQPPPFSAVSFLTFFAIR